MKPRKSFTGFFIIRFLRNGFNEAGAMKPRKSAAWIEDVKNELSASMRPGR